MKSADDYGIKGIEVEGDPFFLVDRLTIELSNRCNYAHAHKFCPAHRIEATEPPVTLAGEVVRQIIDLMGPEYEGMFAFYNYSEPLNDPRLCTFLEYARQACSHSHRFLWTNGWCLTQALFDELSDAGATGVMVSAYTQEEYQRLRGIRRTPTCAFSIGFVARLIDDRLKWYDADAPQRNLAEPCYAPLADVVVRADGNVVLCCLDWGKSVVFGNVNEEGLDEIIRKGQMHAVYDRLSKGDRFLPICQACDQTRNIVRDYRGGKTWRKA